MRPASTGSAGRRLLRAGLSAPLILAIHAYKRIVSPLLGPRCRFHPSCSTYALTAIRTYGPVKGTVLSAWRVMRCNPWNAGGLDPVEAQHLFRPPPGAATQQVVPPAPPPSSD